MDNKSINVHLLKKAIEETTLCVSQFFKAFMRDTLSSQLPKDIINIVSNTYEKNNIPFRMLTSDNMDNGLLPCSFYSKARSITEEMIEIPFDSITNTINSLLNIDNINISPDIALSYVILKKTPSTKSIEDTPFRKIEKMLSGFKIPAFTICIQVTPELNRTVLYINKLQIIPTTGTAEKLPIDKSFILVPILEQEDVKSILLDKMDLITSYIEENCSLYVHTKLQELYFT